MKVEFKGVPPQYMTNGAAGADLACFVDTVIEPGQEVLVPTGTKVAIPEGHFGMLVPRSSTCRKKLLELTNSVGIIDSDYRGELMFSYRNIGRQDVHIGAGERIGQLVILPYVKADLVLVEELTDTERGEGGFGSTGQ
jgi:dUTP pyrophosphatase